MSRYDERIRRWVDGEMSATERQALEAEAARSPELARRMQAERRLFEELENLERVETRPASDDLVERAMRRSIQARREHEQRGTRWLDWLWRPHTLRVRWGTLLVVSAGAAAVALGWIARSAETWPSGAPAQQARTVAQDTPAGTEASSARRSDEAASEGAEVEEGVAVRFTLPVGEASSVAVAGDFNAWDKSATLLEDSDGDGVYVTTLRLPPGTYAYQFVVDGERWLPDPYASNFRHDGFGNRNSVLRID